MSEALAFGRPPGTVIQYAYTVPDLQTAIDAYVDRLGVGPWFKRGPFTPASASYRGAPCEMTITLARAFAGDTMIELIEQHNEAPSIFREVIEQQGYGFHHFAIATTDFDAELERLGYPVVFEDRAPSGARIVYVDSTVDLPGFLEVVEMNESMEQLYEQFRSAAASWDGSDAVRDG
jgi:catechol 2,3-dioxygenase-like lactoylglutathione lyase family enzyme